MSQPLSIDFVSDIVCPWCVVGLLTLERALAEVGIAGDAEIRVRPFELNPWMPEEGQNLREHLRAKYGTTPARSQATRDRLRAMGDELGFAFRFTPESRIVNTFRAHQLLHWAHEEGGADREYALKRALFAANFTEGKDVNDVQTLAEVAEASGLSREEAEAVLYDARYADVVRADEEAWREKGIHAVPSIVLGGRMLLTGAQDQGTFVRAIERALERAPEAAS